MSGPLDGQNILKKDAVPSVYLSPDAFKASPTSTKGVFVKTTKSLKSKSLETKFTGRKTKREKKSLQKIINRRKIKEEENPVRECCAPLCENTELSDEIIMYNFPRNLDARQDWINSLELETTARHARSYIICNKHFTTSDFIPGSKFSLY